MDRTWRIAAKVVGRLVLAGIFALIGLWALINLPPRWRYWSEFAQAETYIARIEAHRARHPCYPSHAEAGIPNTEEGHIFYERQCNFFKIVIFVGFDQTYSFSSICPKWSDGFDDGCELQRP